jgi:hypothetical protein
MMMATCFGGAIGTLVSAGVVSILAICFLETEERIARSTRLDDSINILYNSIIPVFEE